MIIEMDNNVIRKKQSDIVIGDYFLTYPSYPIHKVKVFMRNGETTEKLKGCGSIMCDKIYKQSK